MEAPLFFQIEFETDVKLSSKPMSNGVGNACEIEFETDVCPDTPLFSNFQFLRPPPKAAAPPPKAAAAAETPAVAAAATAKIT